MPTMMTMFADALRGQGLVPLRMSDPDTGVGWVLTRYLQGTWLAVSAGSSPQWWFGQGRWLVEVGNNHLALEIIRRGPPDRRDHLLSGLPEDWKDRLQERA